MPTAEEIQEAYLAGNVHFVINEKTSGSLRDRIHELQQELCQVLIRYEWVDTSKVKNKEGFNSIPRCGYLHWGQIDGNLNCVTKLINRPHVRYPSDYYAA